jgi:hypothetical protein
MREKRTAHPPPTLPDPLKTPSFSANEISPFPHAFSRQKGKNRGESDISEMKLSDFLKKGAKPQRVSLRRRAGIFLQILTYELGEDWDRLVTFVFVFIRLARDFACALRTPVHTYEVNCWNRGIIWNRASFGDILTKHLE